MEWVARMNNIQACARKMVDKEIVYAQNEEASSQIGLAFAFPITADGV